MFCSNCGKELTDDSVFCIHCGSHLVNPVPSPSPEEIKEEPIVTRRKPAKRKKLLPWILTGVAVVAVAVLLIFLLGGRTSPQDGITNLIENGNFTAEAKIMGRKLSVQVDIDWKKQDVTVYAETGGEMAFAIYDGYYITENYYYGYTAMDISNEIEEFFEAYENAQDADWEAVSELIWKTTRVDVETYVDLDELADCMETFEKKLENKSWLKKNAGYSTKRKNGVTQHIYEPDIMKFATASLEIFKSCFDDRDDYDYLLDMLEEYEDYTEDLELSLILGVKGKYLVSAEAEVMGVKIKASITDIGSTKIKTSTLKKLLNNAEII